MRKGIFAFFGLCVAVATVTGIFWSGRGVQAMTVTINVRDFPEHGITIISPSNPSFDGMMTTLHNGQPSAPIEELKPFSVFIKNGGTGDIVAYKLRWECRKQDGTVIYKDASYSNAWILMNGGGANHKDAVAQSQEVIRQNSTWFYSLLAPPQPLSSPDIRLDNGFRVVTGNDDANQMQQLSQDPSVEDVLETLNNELAQYTSITISLDGAFFKNGSFVGTDDSGFFAAVKAEVDAKYDLLVEMQDGVQEGKTADEIFNPVNALAGGEEISLGPESTASDYYNYFKRIYAQEYLANKEKSGGDETITEALEQLDKPWAQLRKL